MNRRMVAVGVIIFLLIGVNVSGDIDTKESTTFFDGNILYVGGSGAGNYTTIQSAVDDAINGDTVFVFDDSAPYYQNIYINKSISLIGEDKNTTIIDGFNNSDTITINYQKVTITDFTICNSSKENWWNSGIRITKSNNRIENNIIKDNLLGIFGKQVENISIIDNIFINDGINFYPYDTEYSYRPSLQKKHFIHNIKNNTVNGKPLLYYIDENDFEVPSNVGQLIAVNCNNMTVTNAIFENTDFMILLVFCSNCLIEKSTIKNNEGELTLLNSDNNKIQYNNITNNFHGILFDYNSNENIIFNNHVLKNQWCGIIFEYFSNKNIIKDNNIIDNKHGNAYMIQSYLNKWINNYWNDWLGLENNLLRLFPKIIYGRHIENNFNPITFLFNFDWHPTSEPYEIG